ncbi:hypothetical protein QLX08_006717 [Tetragonisca angustula]|uniref:Uncharacterized protein n=1 Tax=Tetragonisca angustula TaxID=166442 RepID=A0AAW0ZUJ6_9HYME
MVLGVIRTGTLVACTKCSSGAPSRKHIGEGGGAGAIMALGAHAADGSIISARVSHSHACDQTYPPVLTLRILETANPNSIVLQLLTASSPSRMKDSLLSNALTPVTQSGATDCSDNASSYWRVNPFREFAS